MLPFRFGLHSSIAPTIAAWRDRARMGEDLGYAALYVPDHLDAQFGPIVAATIAAEATSTLHVGTLVLNNDLRNPVVLAKEVATLCLAAEGRIEVGLGAGWLRSDYDAAGIDYDPPGARVDRLAESLGILRSLWHGDESSVDGPHYAIHDARCEPRPAAPPRLIVGGGSRRVLTVAAAHADTVGINTSLASGERHDDVQGKATIEHFDRCLAWVRAAAGDRPIELQVAAFNVTVASSHRAAARSAMLLGFHGEEALDLPVLLIGTIDDLCERLLQRRERWGFSNIVVPDEAMTTFAPVVSRLAGT